MTANPHPMHATTGLGQRLYARPQLASLALCLPALAYLGVFYILPLVQVALRSFSAPDFGLGNYARIIESPVYLQSFFITFWISAVVAVVCLLLAYPTAWALTRLSGGWLRVAFALVMVPYWTSALVRTYGWSVILQRRGLVNQMLQGIGLTDAPLQIIYTTLGTVIGTVHVLLPMTILTLYAGLVRIDTSLLRSARTLGARPRTIFWRVYLPLSLPAVLAAAALTFIASLGSYIIPALLGGRQDLFVGQLIGQQISQLLNPGFASALAMVLMVICVPICLLYTRLLTRQSMRSGAATDRILAGETSRAGLPARAVLMLVLGFLILPSFVLLPLSFSASRYLTLPPPGYSLQWYQGYLSDPAWLSATWRSLRIASLAALIATLLAVPAALGLARLQGWPRYVLFTLFLAPLLVPNTIYALAAYQLFSAIGLIGTETGLVLAHAVIGLPYTLITLGAALTLREQRLGLAARGLGAGPVRAFGLVQFPLVRGSIVVGAVLAFIASFDDIILAIFISGPRSVTLPKMMWDAATNEVNPIISAVSVLIIIGSMTLIGLSGLLMRKDRGQG